MDPNAKKTALRMIPYGLFVLTAANKEGEVAAATVNWVTQVAFEPPLVVVGVKADSHAHALIKQTQAFALNVLGKGQQGLAFTFFKPAEKKGDTISGEGYRAGSTGSPILASTPAFIECTLEATVERYNTYAEKGEDPDWGDPGQTHVLTGPDTVNRKPVTGPVFGAIQQWPGTLGTNGGLRVDKNARVLGYRTPVIDGLYAAGNTAASVLGAIYGGGGSCIGPSVTFGYIAGRHLAGQPSRDIGTVASGSGALREGAGQ